MRRVGRTYASCAQHHCGDQLSQTLALEVLLQLGRIQEVAERAAYNLPLHGISDLVKQLVTH